MKLEDMPLGTTIERTTGGEMWLVPFELRGNLPVLEAKLGNWRGPVLYDTGAAKTVIDYTFADYMSTDIIDCMNERANGVAGSVSIDHQARVDIHVLGYTFKAAKVYLMDSIPAFKKGTFHAIIGGDLIRKMPPITPDYVMMRMKVPKLRIHTSPEASLINVQVLDKQLRDHECAAAIHNSGYVNLTGEIWVKKPESIQQEQVIRRPIPPPRPSLLRKRIQLQTDTDLNETIYQNEMIMNPNCSQNICDYTRKTTKLNTDKCYFQDTCNHTCRSLSVNTNERCSQNTCDYTRNTTKYNQNWYNNYDTMNPAELQRHATKLLTQLTKSIQLTAENNSSNSVSEFEDKMRRAGKDVNLFEIDVGVAFNARQLARSWIEKLIRLM